MASVVLLQYSYVSQGFFNFPFLIISKGGWGGGGGGQHAGDFLTYNFKEHWGGGGVWGAGLCKPTSNHFSHIPSLFLLHDHAS